MIVYFDTSALVKLVFDELGSGVAAELWDRADMVVSGQLVYPEARAAMAAAHRGARIDAATLRAATRTIEELYAELRVIVLDDRLARAAGELAERHALRGYDAVHLACALGVEDSELVLATWDRNLATAALAAGCAVAPGWGRS